ncbi:MAG TPA: substrate-binding domain-containing protein [Fimbriiglobus sp.]|jgi:ribose transport system substrate-binding protein|nr:substrate-binding domain-containing protein [Fimbriiglobus sp.]
MRVRLLLLIAVALPLASCQSDEPAPARRAIGVSLLTLTNPFFTEIAENLRDEAAKHGYEVILVSGENDAARQNQQVEDFIARRVDAIVLSPCDSKAVGQSIRKANAAGVPVFTVDIACLDPGAQVVSHIATDNYAGGRQAADAIREALGGRGGRVGVLDYKEVESCILRVKGFKDALAEHNRTAAAKVEIVAELPCGGARDRGYKSMEDMLQAHPDLAAVFAINDLSALGARAALEKAGRADRVKLIGFDGQPEGKKAIGEGKIYADPIQYPGRIGRTAAAAIVRYFDGEEVEKEVLIPTGLYRKADAVKEGLGS